MRAAGVALTVDLSRRKLLVGAGRALAGVTAARLMPWPLAGAAEAAAGHGSLDAAGYWAFADRLFPFFEGQWSPALGVYAFRTHRTARTPDSLTNAALLLTHAVAARAGHGGPSRQDERARSIAERLCGEPYFVAQPGRECGQYHVPGWVRSLVGGGAGCMHVSWDPQIAEALAHAHQARAELALPAPVAALIEDRLARVAGSAFFRFPSIRLNQINWYAQMYAAAAAVTGDGRLLREDYRQQLVRFAIGIKARTHGHRTTNLAPDYRFHYSPERPAASRSNLDSPEYASIVLTALRHYPAALAAGMRPLSRQHVSLLRAWVEHAVCAYWTHAGYLNWDTGLGTRRWGYGQYWAWAQQGLQTIAVTEAFQARPELGAWAKHFFDRGLGLYERLAQEGDPAGLAPPPLAFTSRFTPSRVAFVARMQANAARAVALGLGARSAKEPPPLYAFDPGIGRLAITTPSYSTAILPVNQRALPYGGLEPARLFDGDQRVVSNVAGRPPASFGTLVTGPGGRRELTSQLGLSRSPRGRPPLVLTRSPAGRVGRGRPFPARPYAGPFRRIEESGYVDSRHLRLRSAHAFERDFIEGRVTVRRKRGRVPYTVTLLFPTYGARGSVTAVMRDRRRIPLTAGRRLRLGEVSYFHLSSGPAGYVVVPQRREGARARVLRPSAQATARTPGPTLALELVRGSRFRSLSQRFRFAPAASASQAAAMARRLRF